MEGALALLGSLTRQREHVVGILEGLSEEQLRRRVLPSGWNCLDLVHHLDLDVEHYWFRCIFGGESLEFFTTASNDEAGAWHVPPDLSADDVLRLYRDEIERSDAIAATTPLDMAPRQRDPWWGEWDVPDFAFILLHVIAETACHAGHLDAVVELLTGRQWIVL